MSNTVSVKRCPNPKCVRNDRIYLNGASQCELCGTPLSLHDLEVQDEASATLTTMLDLRASIKSLLNAK